MLRWKLLVHNSAATILSPLGWRELLSLDRFSSALDAMRVFEKEVEIARDNAPSRIFLVEDTEQLREISPCLFQTD
jgi:hypothetical protein